MSGSGFSLPRAIAFSTKVQRGPRLARVQSSAGGALQVLVYVYINLLVYVYINLLRDTWKELAIRSRFGSGGFASELSDSSPKSVSLTSLQVIDL